jgi:hypothetical protein
MATLTLEPELRRALGDVLGRLPHFDVSSTDDAVACAAVDGLSLAAREPLDVLLRACRGLIAENGWAHVRALPSTGDGRGIHALGHGLGRLFRDLRQQSSIVVEACPGIGQALQGCQTRKLPLHTDFAMLERPPAVTIIACVREDPAGPGFVTNGLADVRELEARYVGDADLEVFRSLSLPFAGRMPSGQEVLIERPIISNPSRDGVSLRFHPSRVHHGFRVRGRPATAEESAILRAFPRLAESVRTELRLAVGDVLVVDNRRVLHDRSRCTLALGSTGVSARVAHVLFVDELWHA